MDEFASGRINVLVSVVGGQKPKLIFSAHTDTMPVGAHEGDGAWNHPPFGAEVVDGKLRGAGALLVSEPSPLDLLIAETGALWLDITSTGAPGHASAGREENAILKLMDFLDAVRSNPFADHTHPY